MNKCLQCGQTISDKAKFCSDSHRKAYSRRLQEGETPDSEVGQIKSDINPDKLTRTDLSFENHKPGFYRFDFKDGPWERDCFACGKGFKTHLNLLEFCSRDCQVVALRKLTGDRT